MKKIYSKYILILVCFLTVLCFTSACDDDGEVNNGQVTVLSFGPAGVKHGETISFIGHNLNKVESIELPGAPVTKDNFITHTADLIELTVPAAATPGKVMLTLADGGTIETKTMLSFEVPVSVASFTAEAKPGTNITITGDFVNWIESVTFADDVVVTEFVSKSLNETVVTVPLDARTGPLVFHTGGTEPLEIISETDLSVILPSVTGLAPDPVERGSELTITGTHLDLVSEVRFKGNVSVMEEDFISKSETEIVVIFPQEANKGTIAVVAYSGEEVESEMAIGVAGDLPPLEALGLAFYTDALANGWQKWGGWGGGSADLANAENVRDGEKAIKVVFVGGWGGAMQLGGGNTATGGHSEFVISIFGDAGTGGKQLNLVIKNGGAATEKIISVVEGEWTEYKFSIVNDLGGIATITELFLQDRDWSGTLYVDHIGLR